VNRERRKNTWKQQKEKEGKEGKNCGRSTERTKGYKYRVEFLWKQGNNSVLRSATARKEA
jgi:hypothetical protein